MSEVKVWILNSPAAPNLRLLEQLPGSTHIVVGESEEAFENAPDPDVVVCGIGKARLLRALWPRIQQARWLHSLTAGLESVLFPELVESPITMTNAKGVYGRSLGSSPSHRRCTSPRTSRA